jgi:uncharacterized protein with von Willebrand factor type A (vWA) domain
MDDPGVAEEGVPGATRAGLPPLDGGVGGSVDGQRLLAAAVGFGRALRAAGLPVDLGASIDFARALTLVEIGSRVQVWAAGATIFVRRRDDLEIYSRVFDRYWRPPGSGARFPVPPPLERRESRRPGVPPDLEPGDERVSPREGNPRLAALESEAGEGTSEGLVVAPTAYSRLEVLRHLDFERMTGEELRDAERCIDLLVPALETRRTRRFELARRGRRVAARALFRRNLATGGELVTWVWRRPLRRPRPLVVLCDISGSMERHSRLLLRFILALAAANPVRVEAFVFGTRLTRVTRLVRDRDRDRALARVAAAVTDWAGGTRIGEAFHEFNQRWARRTLPTSGIVIVISDGWDRGDPDLVARETARLRRNCHRLIWLNPLAGAPGYQPIAAGMAAAYPYIDDFLPAGSLASLERLGRLLAGLPEAEMRPLERSMGVGGLGGPVPPPGATPRRASGQAILAASRLVHR